MGWRADIAEKPFSNTRERVHRTRVRRGDQDQLLFRFCAPDQSGQATTTSRTSRSPYIA